MICPQADGRLDCAGTAGKDAALKCLVEKRDALVAANAAQQQELIATYATEVRHFLHGSV